MKVMQINCVYQNGSTGKIVYDIHTYLQKVGHDSVVCYGRGDEVDEHAIYKTCGEMEARLNKLYARLTGVKFGGSYFSTNQLLKIIRKEKPDIVHLQCINGYFVNIFRLVTYLKTHRIPTVLTLHAEFMYTGSCGYALECERWKNGCGCCPRVKKETHSFFFDGTAISWKHMKKAFDGFDDLRVVSVSPWVQMRAQESPIFCDKIHTTILNGLDTSVFRYRDQAALREQMNLQNKKIVFHVTSFFSERKDHIKGGYYILEAARYFADVDLDVVFVVAGAHEPNIDVPSNVLLLGNIRDQDMLATYYSMADITLLTSQKETFSMIVAESLCCGTPVVGFEAGAPEMIAIKEFSNFVPHGDTALLIKQMEKYLYDKKLDPVKISESAKQKYGKDVMGKQYLTLYQNMIN